MCKPRNQAKGEFKSEREHNPNIIIRIVRAIQRIITRRIQEAENRAEQQVIVENHFNTIEEASDEEVLELEGTNEEI